MFGNNISHCPETAPADYGPNPFVVDIAAAVQANPFYRSALWTGDYLQLTLMCIPSGGDIGLEMHADVDQLLCVTEGRGVVQYGDGTNQPLVRYSACAGSAVFIPAGTWHNLINCGCRALKLFSVYAPPNHPHGTVHPTKADAGE